MHDGVEFEMGERREGVAHDGYDRAVRSRQRVSRKPSRELFSIFGRTYLDMSIEIVRLN
jgi:hypothetical protein